MIFADVTLRRPYLKTICVILLSIMLVGAPYGAVPENLFKKATPGRMLQFPRDHGKHPDFETEWWYFTGHLKDSKGVEYGFQVTFFRRGMFKDANKGDSQWAVRDVYPAHFALSDPSAGKFYHSELISREGPGLAEASQDKLHIRVKDWYAKMKGDKIQLAASSGSENLQLTLTPEKPLVLHGSNGFSIKGNNPSQASYYYSFTRLKAIGALKIGNVKMAVTGTAWMDHEFGSSVMLADQSGWDWFSIQMDDRSELMVFNMRKQDNSKERYFGTYVRPDGVGEDLKDMEITIDSKETWKSPLTQAVYPSGWKISIKELGLNLNVVPLMKDQELISKGSTGIVYWEGAVKARGAKHGKQVTGRGYVELTGYAHSMAGRL